MEKTGKREDGGRGGCSPSPAVSSSMVQYGDYGQSPREMLKTF